MSEGGSVAILTGLTYPKPLAGILAHSAYLPLAKYFENDAFTDKLVNKNVPIFLTQGLWDPLQLKGTAMDTCDALARFNRNVVLRVFTMAMHMPNKHVRLYLKNTNTVFFKLNPLWFEKFYKNKKLPNYFQLQSIKSFLKI